MYSIVIKNGTVVDGTGNPGKILDIAIQGDKIVNIAENINSPAQKIIDATGKVVSPGFIDLQNHSDSYWQIFDNPSLESLTSQGFTTILVGNCGASLAPLLTHDALLAMQKWHNLDGVNINWVSFSEFIEEISKKSFGCNIASLVGYSTLRRSIVGDQIRSLEKTELNALKKALTESLEAGAFGLSNGLSYAHEIIISELELFELAKIIKKYNSLFAIHLRSEGREIIEAIDEAIDIANNTEVNTLISHLKIKGENNFPKFSEALTLIETAYHRGTNIHFNLYPYDTMWQHLYTYLPKWAIEGGRAIMLKHFADPTQKNKILMHLNNSGIKFSEIKVASTANNLNYVGKSIGQIAKNLECSSEQAVLHLIQNGGAEVMVFEKNLDTDQVNDLLFHPLSFLGTDGGGFPANYSGGLVHPRSFGTATKFLNLVQGSKVLSMEKAIRKLTSGPAKKIGLKKRGEIKVDYFADIVIFNPITVKDKSTFENPYLFSEGIDYVFVNGKTTIENSNLTKNLPGYILRNS